MFESRSLILNCPWRAVLILPKRLAAVPGVIDVAVNLASETAKVTYLQGVLRQALAM